MKCKEPNILNKIHSIKPTKLSRPNHFFWSKSRETKSTEYQSKVQFQLDLSLAQLSSSLFLVSFEAFFYICHECLLTRQAMLFLSNTSEPHSIMTVCCAEERVWPMPVCIVLSIWKRVKGIKESWTLTENNPPVMFDNIYQETGLLILT